MTYEKFFEYWTGYAIFCEPDVGFKKSGECESLSVNSVGCDKKV